MAHTNEDLGSAAARPRPGDIDLRLSERSPGNSISRLRLQHLARCLHSLGPLPLYYFLTEIERGAPLREHLEAYAELVPLGDFIRVNGGEEFSPPFVIDGGAGG